MAEIPRDHSPESTLALLSDPYRFIGRRARRLRSDVFSTRLMARRTICMTGREAAALFYDTSLMKREGAMPLRIRKTLLGEGGVQGMDGAAHRARKAMLLAVATGDATDGLLRIAARQWRIHVRDWQAQGEIRFYAGMCSLLARTACEWVGIPADEFEASRRTRQIVALFDGAGAVGPRHWKARISRRETEHWLSSLVRRVRAGSLACDAAAPLAVVARHVDADGTTLDERTAAVELLNLIRPVTAVAVYAVFVAHALHAHPREMEKLRTADPAALDRFVQEVRRFYPFFPAVAARTCLAFSWQGLDFPADVRVMFDLYGTNHDPRIWRTPWRFAPSRFEMPFDVRFDLVPQGGGEHADGHRCPGEWITLALMKQTAQILADGISCTVPERAAPIAFDRLPALPRGGLVLRDVRARAGWLS
ncbi:cytochrome P450 [Luteimonas suaedae]|uniref:cytochrome P450 n=1 Tax=Luteimonas suaedae TaxID=2605430 RepID=UPI001CA881B9|nr:cytochrome P450 [Luteimonas suaedae]